MVLAMAGAVLACGPRAAHAQQLVFDPKNHLENALQAARQLESLANEAHMLTNQARELASSPYSHLTATSQTLSSIGELAGAAKGLASDVAGLQADFEEIYPAIVQGLDPQTALKLRQERNATARNTARDLASAAAELEQMAKARPGRLQGALAASQSAIGQTAAIQSSAQVLVRVRKGPVVAAGLASAALCAGALAWAFIIQPDLRAQARQDEAVEDDQGRAPPLPQIAEGPATYGDLEPLQDVSQRPASAQPQPAAPPRSPLEAPAHRGARPMDRASEARTSPLFFAQAHSGQVAQVPPARADLGGDPRTAGQDAYNSDNLLDLVSPYELKAGSVIPALLLTGVDTARAGPVTAAVTDSIYDTVTGQHLLIPQGSRLIGRHEGESRHGDKRVFLVWDRLILPNGKSLVLDREPGVDAQGMIGVEGKVERRLLPLVAASLIGGAITALGQMARDEADASRRWVDDAGDAAAIEAAQVGGRLIDRELDVRPSIQVRPGARVRVLITHDLVLEPYAP
ncbi:P-type conjugative transfer protein TrbJ [Phenylobacterium koreense]|uniref:P-type conjugative transfer protein TrbJ n=2 Tax=Phenylobacterium koreense TaxID=266125 RepID=A0ABV2EM75_9CAUL